jgi:hypothetical protein
VREIGTRVLEDIEPDRSRPGPSYARWETEYERWQHRDLSARRYVYIWADGVYLQARMEPDAECILVVIGATPEGRKELVGFHVGIRESAQSWRELLVDLKAQGPRRRARFESCRAYHAVTPRFVALRVRVR